MEPTTQVLMLPLNAFLLAAVGMTLVLVGGLVLLRLSRRRKTETTSDQERDWRIPVIDAHADRQSLFHNWDPRIKLVSIMFFMFCVVSLTQLLWAGLALLVAIVSVAVAGIPLRHPLRRLGAMAAFLIMFLVVMPVSVVTRSGDTLVVFEHLDFVSFNLRGFLLALLICLKGCAVALLVEPLLATAPLAVTMQALARLRMPPMICQMFLLAHRYVFVFQNEAARMVKGMNARGFRKRTDRETLHTLGDFLGMLLVRSFERTQRVYDAMLARGYQGVVSGSFEFRSRNRDWILAAVWIAAGMLFLVADRVWYKLP
jgi:cobalt/nickel transport system permease protein